MSPTFHSNSSPYYEDAMIDLRLLHQSFDEKKSSALKKSFENFSPVDRFFYVILSGRLSLLDEIEKPFDTAKRVSEFFATFDPLWEVQWNYLHFAAEKGWIPSPLIEFIETQREVWVPFKGLKSNTMIYPLIRYRITKELANAWKNYRNETKLTRYRNRWGTAWEKTQPREYFLAHFESCYFSKRFEGLLNLFVKEASVRSWKNLLHDEKSPLHEKALHWTDWFFGGFGEGFAGTNEGKQGFFLPSRMFKVLHYMTNVQDIALIKNLKLKKSEIHKKAIQFFWKDSDLNFSDTNKKNSEKELEKIKAQHKELNEQIKELLELQKLSKKQDVCKKISLSFSDDTDIDSTANEINHYFGYHLGLCSYALTDKEPQIMPASKAFNSLSNAISLLILNTEDKEEAQEIARKALLVAEKCVELGNYFGAYSIFRGIDSAPISRLPGMTEILNSSSLPVLFSGTQGSKNYLTHVKKQKNRLKKKTQKTPKQCVFFELLPLTMRGITIRRLQLRAFENTAKEGVLQEEFEYLQLYVKVERLVLLKKFITCSILFPTPVQFDWGYQVNDELIKSLFDEEDEFLWSKSYEKCPRGQSNSNHNVSQPTSS